MGDAGDETKRPRWIRRRAWRAAGASTLALTLTACGGSGDNGGTAAPVTHVALDGTARTQDDAGVLTSLADDFTSLVLDGETVYEVSPTVQSFASIDGSTQPLRGRVGQYVHVGLDRGKVVWLAGLGAVVRVDGQPERVLYLGRITSVRGRTITLQDGTVLEACSWRRRARRGERGQPPAGGAHHRGGNRSGGRGRAGMTRRVRTALICVAGFTVSFAIVLVVGTLLGDDGGERAGSDSTALSVEDALRVAAGEEVAVRGFVFFDPQTGPLMCSERTGDERPACDGTVLQIDGLDPNRLDLVHAEIKRGGYDAWSRGEVVVRGIKFGATLQVADILR